MKNETIKTIKTVRIYEELDPCVAPEGCPELEPWMAYVGKGQEGLSGKFKSSLDTYYGHLGIWLDGAGGFDIDCHYAIDVRTAWSQENFPEHCRIRDYQEPDAFEEFCEAWALDSLQYASPKWFKEMMKQAYELGQANPIK